MIKISHIDIAYSGKSQVSTPVVDMIITFCTLTASDLIERGFALLK